MDELIYRFLLDAGYPRAAIVGELELLAPAAARAGSRAGTRATNGSAESGDGQSSGQSNGGGPPVPDYAIVDPATFDTLAVLVEVPAVDDDDLAEAAIELGDYARLVGGRSVQGFVVRIDPKSSDADEMVQFYRVWPNEMLERVSPQSFPDLDTLRTRSSLARIASGELVQPGASGQSVGEPRDEPRADPRHETFDFEGTPGEADRAAEQERVAALAAENSKGPSLFRWVPGVLLVALTIADRLTGAPADGSMLGMDQAVLASAAGVALVLAALARR